MTNVRIVASVIVDIETDLATREVAAREEVITSSVDAAIVTVKYLKIGKAMILRVACKHAGVAVFNENLFSKHIVVGRISGIGYIQAYAFYVSDPYIRDHTKVRPGVRTVPLEAVIVADCCARRY